MAVEAKRGCGYRKVGGIYLIGEGIARPCDRLPYALDKPCPTCGHGIKFSRGIQWLDGKSFFGENCPNLVKETFLPEEVQTDSTGDCHAYHCPICNSEEMGKIGLMWVGEKFYPSPENFIEEAQRIGVSKRIAISPKQIELGKTWILLAHIKGMRQKQDNKAVNGYEAEIYLLKPAIFYAFRVTKIEQIITDQTPEEEIDKLKDRGITPVVVPFFDSDHNPDSKKCSITEAPKLSVV